MKIYLAVKKECLINKEYCYVVIITAINANMIKLNSVHMYLQEVNVEIMFKLII